MTKLLPLLLILTCTPSPRPILLLINLDNKHYVGNVETGVVLPDKDSLWIEESKKRSKSRDLLLINVKISKEIK